MGKTSLATNIAFNVAKAYRKGVLPDGSEGMASFDTLKFLPHEYPLGTVFMCRHKTRDMVWVPSLLEHPNGAQGIAGVVAGCDDPEGAAAAFAS